MSHTLSNRGYREYLANLKEPEDATHDGAEHDGAEAELVAALIENIYYQKRKLRRAAERLRYNSL